MKFNNIDGFEGYYISKRGKLYSKLLSTRNKDSKWRVVKPRLMKNGYLRVLLHIKGRVPKAFYIHRLVAMAWIPNPDNLPMVMHLDNDRSNNKVSNLRWGTQSDNMIQATNDGMMYKQHQKGWLCHNSKLTKKEFLEVIILIDLGYSNKEVLAKVKFKVSYISIYNLRKRYLRGDYKCLFTYK